jgi:hypothetical protein
MANSPVANTDSELPIAWPDLDAPRPMTWVVRGALIIIGLGLAGVFGVAAWLRPYEDDGTPRRMATHTQLGMSPCNFLVWTGKPCPSCGMTTSFAFLMHGDVGNSLKANAVGTLLALFWLALVPWSLLSAVRGKLLFVRPGMGEYLLTAAVGFFVAAMLLRWAIVLVWK